MGKAVSRDTQKKSVEERLGPFEGSMPLEPSRPVHTGGYREEMRRR
jgi:hypothetical protein